VLPTEGHDESVVDIPPFDEIDASLHQRQPAAALALGRDPLPRRHATLARRR
jgi:hypothetical protein